MLGKLAVGGVAAAVAGYKKLEGMESDDIRGIASKVTKAVSEFGESAKEKADKLPFVQSVKETIASNKTASKVFSTVGKAVGKAGSGISAGFQSFMERMADAKEAADKDKGAGAEKSTFMKHVLEQMKDGATSSVKNAGRGAVLGVAGLMAKMTGSDKMQEAVDEMKYGSKSDYKMGLKYELEQRNAEQRIGPPGGPMQKDDGDARLALSDAVQTGAAAAEKASTTQVIEKAPLPAEQDKDAEEAGKQNDMEAEL